MGELVAFLEARAAALAEDETVPWDALDGATFCVTGATGLIGSQLVRTLKARKLAKGDLTPIVLPVRNVHRAQRMFGKLLPCAYVGWQAGFELHAAPAPDYIVHGASPTESAAFVNHPAETIQAILDGSQAVLYLAEDASSKKVLLLSTMEVYGGAYGKVDETTFGPLDPMQVRSSYPEAKRMAECLFAAYASEFGMPASVLRLAQTFGEGVMPTDTRAFAEFGRQALAGSDVTLVTSGTKRNPYLSVDDAVRAILIGLVRAEPGEAYNVANEATYVSVRELAETAIATLSPSPDAKVVYKLDATREGSFRPASELDLDTAKFHALGWEPTEDLPAMFSAMAKGWEANRYDLIARGVLEP